MHEGDDKATSSTHNKNNVTSSHRISCSSDGLAHNAKAVIHLKPDITARCCGKCSPSFSRSQWWCPSYLVDWLFVFVLTIAVGIEYAKWTPTIRPFEPSTEFSNGTLSFSDNQFMFDQKSNLFEEWVTALISVLAPCFFPLLYHAYQRLVGGDTSLHDVHHYYLGLATTIIVAFFAFFPINRSIGAFRPDFLDRLQSGIEEDIELGRESFPSGHNLTAFAGLGFIMFWLSGKLRTFHSSRGNMWRFFLSVMCPMALAIAQGVSRVTDNRHRTSDILGGCLLGMAVATCAYHLHYPPLYAPDCDRPKNRRWAAQAHSFSGVPVAPDTAAADPGRRE